MATPAPLFTCPVDSKQFGSAAGLRGHQNKTGHKGSALIPAGEKVNMPTKAAKAEKATTTTKADEKAAQVAANKAEREAKKAAKEAAKAEAAAKRAEAKAKRDAPRTEPCECGCGGIPAGRKSRFLPGHDAKKASAEKESAKA